MMQTISLQGKVSDDGVLRLEVPAPMGARGKDVEVVVVMQQKDGEARNIASSDWVDESYGACADDPIERPHQGSWPVREEIS